MNDHLRFFNEKNEETWRYCYTLTIKLSIIVVESGTKCQKVGDFMFIGEYKHNLDAKGRMIIPAKFREQFGASMIVTRGLDGCLTVYSLIQWNQILDQLKKLPSTKRESRMYMHMLTAKAAEVSLDNQGRILLPDGLIEAAQLKKECVVIGVVDHVEIWDQATWNAYYEKASDSFEDIAESLTDFIR